MWIGIKSTTMVSESIHRAAYSLPAPAQNMPVSILALSIIDDRKNLHLSKKAVNYFVQEEAVT
jgi:hypothetical protein